ncbi:MAG: hypothetical protein Q8N91_03150 [Candidatus Omnitrophota bacterium]|nr:hypothetical protein [Candidatus Omnitrophota bacterium]
MNLIITGLNIKGREIKLKFIDAEKIEDTKTIILGYYPTTFIFINVSYAFPLKFLDLIDSHGSKLHPCTSHKASNRRRHRGRETSRHQPKRIHQDHGATRAQIVKTYVVGIKLYTGDIESAAKSHTGART